jgi:hypothetical protein
MDVPTGPELSGKAPARYPVMREAARLFHAVMSTKWRNRSAFRVGATWPPAGIVGPSLGHAGNGQILTPS